jgi:hypothetical protein
VYEHEEAFVFGILTQPADAAAARAKKKAPAIANVIRLDFIVCPFKTWVIEVLRKSGWYQGD